jgi:hypothetical protein
MLVFDALSDLDDTFILSTEGKEKEKREGRFTTIPVDRIPGHDAFDIYAYSERSYFGELVNILHLNRNQSGNSCKSGLGN